MKARVITSDESKLIGFRIAGIKGEKITNKESFIEFFKNCNDDSIALIIITSELYDKYTHVIEEFRNEHEKPLIVRI
ncbi:MAG: V-type ATP synthase subunit F [Tissierellia bacterium]|nr:V-type ATP synthase subunit F [Tissierellia bacterium]